MKFTKAALTMAATVIVAGAGVAYVIEGSAESSTAGTARASGRATVDVFDDVLNDLRRTVTTLELFSTSDAPASRLERHLSSTGIVGVSHIQRAGGAAALQAGATPAAISLTDITAGTALAREAAADTGETHVAVPVRGAIAVIVPVYAAGRPVLTTDQRRAELTGWTVGLIDAEALRSRLGPSSSRAALTVNGIDAVTSSDSTLKQVEVDGTVELAHAVWRLRVTPEVPGGLAGATWAVLISSLTAAVAVLLVGLRDRGAFDRIVASHDALLRETRIAAELGPILQASLDLGEVLPAVAVHLSDEFGLMSVALELIGDDGSLVEVFSMGTRPQVSERSGAISPAEEVVCPLVRSGRTVGRLRAVPGRALSAAEISAIRAGAELVAVTTSNVELYEREQASVRRLTELDQLKDAFLGTISHELRTPITAIRGFVQLLADRGDDFTDEDRKEFLQRIERNSTSLGLLVDDLLDFARLDRQSIVTPATPVRVDLAVASLVAQLTPLLGEHRIVTAFDPEVEALADLTALERVLANLLTNAAKFSPAETTIEIGVSAGDGCAQISIADEGPGIAMEDRQRIFTRFYRGDSPAALATRGAGIGLAVVRELVVQMGGTIAVEENRPTGTRMIVRLPQATPGPIRIPDQAAVPQQPTDTARRMA